MPKNLMIKFILAIILGVLIAVLAISRRSAHAEEIARSPRPGDVMTFVMKAYHITVAEQTLSVSKGAPEGETQTLALAQHTKSTGVGTMLGSMDNRIVSTVNAKTLAPVKFERHINEGDWKSEDVFRFTSGKIIGHEERGANREKIRDTEVKFDPKDTVYDEVSIIFYMRTLPLAEGNSWKVKVFTDGEAKEESFSVKEKVKVKTKMGKFDAWRVTGTMNEAEFWVSDTPERLLLKYNIQTKAGAVAGYLQSWEPGK